MARTNTTNLNLVQPDRLDQYNVDDFNSNMEKIDNFAGLVPPRALTADKLTVGKNINGVLFDGSKSVITGLGLHSMSETYAMNNIAYTVEDGKIKLHKSLQDQNQGHATSEVDWWEEVKLGGGANEELSNLTSVGKNIANWSTNVTNCITSIPQDIKVELNNGTVTLKAGSKIYYPNGVGKFDTINTTKDISRNTFATTDGLYLMALNSLDNLENLGMSNFKIDLTFAGETKPSEKYNGWYDTINNIFVNQVDQQRSFPFCLVKIEKNIITSIETVFNGFGFIGSLFYALPNVKGLIPNGRNEDGTLKSIEFISDNVYTRNYKSSDGSRGVYFNPQDTESPFGVASDVYYDKEKNLNIEKGTGANYNKCLCFYRTYQNNQVTYFKAKQPFHAMDSNLGNSFVPDYSGGIKIAKQTIEGSGFVAPVTGVIISTCGFSYEGKSKLTIDGNVLPKAYFYNAGNVVTAQHQIFILNKGSIFKCPQVFFENVGTETYFYPMKGAN